MNIKHINHLLLSSLVLGIAPALADDTSDKEQEKPGFFRSMGNAVDGAHENLSSRFTNFVIEVDDFIGTAQEGENINKSWARVRVDTIRTDVGETEFKAKVKLRIVLPQSENRFRLLLSSGDDQSIAGLRFLRKARKSSSVKFDIGARWRDDKAQLFGRVGIVAQKSLNDDWTLTASNNYFHYSSSGFENQLQFDFRRPVLSRDRTIFRNSTEFRWLEDRKGVSIGGITGIYADRGPKAAYALEVLGSATTEEFDGAYYLGTEVRLRVRRNAFRPWLYFEIWPSVNWSQSNDYERTYGGRIRVEANFGR